MSVFQKMIERTAQPGALKKILLRPKRLETPVLVLSAGMLLDGLEGDHSRPGKRAVTLVQDEYLAVIGAMLGQDAVDPVLLRRNLVVSVGFWCQSECPQGTPGCHWHRGTVHYWNMRALQSDGADTGSGGIFCDAGPWGLVR